LSSKFHSPILKTNRKPKAGSRQPEAENKKALRRSPHEFAGTERRARFFYDDLLELFSFYGVLKKSPLPPHPLLFAANFLRF
jgi:hypothetical protein